VGLWPGGLRRFNVVDFYGGGSGLLLLRWYGGE
jgi:hypothetical protein